VWLLGDDSVRQPHVQQPLIFLAEYARILFMRLLFCIILGSDLYSSFFMLGFFISFLFICVRGIVPRFRYD
jgi:hypothetical protein